MLDCIVIGAGAAGIGAGLALLRAKADFVVLEAKDRVGGRAYTDETSLGMDWDQGCHWFHSASRNPLRQLALKLKHPFMDQPRPYAHHIWHGGKLKNNADVETAYEALGQRLSGFDSKGPDMPLSALMDGTSAWHGLLRHGMALNSSHEPESISVLETIAYDETHENIPVSGGYGRLVARLADGLPIRLRTAVTAIEVRPNSVIVATDAGDVEAATAIIAVPARVLERRAIRFTPSLPPEIETVFDNITLGWFEKVAFAFDEPVLNHLGEGGVEAEVTYQGEAWQVFFQLNGNGQALAIAHLAGHRARDLSEKDRVVFCEEALLQCFGHGIRRHIKACATSRWRDDPFIGGAYACAKPGFAHLRQRLSQPLFERIHFAGEHVSSHAMTTAHGAYVSGLEAAQRAMRQAGRGIEIDPLWLPEGV